ncbi:MAG: signal peptidase II [Kiritimatiellae bacterium]|nr:signal peptidase II [Kiritimatiellia bacterium]
MKRLLVTVVVVLNLVLADAVAKELARGLLGPGAEGGPRVVEAVPGLFNLAYVENRGCAWGMFQGRVWPLAAFGALALAFLAWKRRSVFAPGRLAAAAEPLLYAGIAGNLIDRVFRGYVIDMLDFHWGPHHFPCFNLADTLICVAVGLLLLASFAAPRQVRPS